MTKRVSFRLYTRECDTWEGISVGLERETWMSFVKSLNSEAVIAILQPPAPTCDPNFAPPPENEKGSEESANTRYRDTPGPPNRMRYFLNSEFCNIVYLTNR